MNAAGGYTLGRISHELSAEDWDIVLDSNLKGSFLCCKHVIPHMLAGVLGLTRHLAKECAARGILV
ncbi:MAG: SDR family NAD(P)-dependent oxidoreductase [Candidatus Rokuibacteriota bacterium]